MGAKSHVPNVQRLSQRELGRPPGIEARACAGLVYSAVHAGNETEPRPCQMGALWVVPEAPYCAHHMPLTLLPVAAERMARWIDLGAWVWSEIVAETELEP